MDAVDQVLARRALHADGPSGSKSLVAAALLHAVVLAGLWIAPQLGEQRKPLEFVPVQIIPAQALGVERPLGRPKREEPRPEPPKAAEPAPEPAAPEPAVPEQKRPPEPQVAPPAPSPRKEAPRPLPRDERPAPPRPEPKPEPKRPAPGGAEAAAGTRGAGGQAAVGKGEELGRRGSASGNPLGTSAFGSAIAGLEDPNFGYGYYVDRLLQLIDAQWTRPPMGGDVRTVLYFRIQRGGGIEGLEIEESSGYNSFDLAALRAVQNAAPFPSLPASYRNPSLGVHLIVH